MDAVLTRIPRSSEIYEAALEGLTRMNEAIYRTDPSLPDIHDANVRYRREAGEVWRHAKDVLIEGWGDCEDLAGARAGWLRARRVDPRARVIVKRTGPRMSHALVKRGNGKIEDPSRELGMGSPEEGQTVMDPLGRKRVIDMNDEREETERGEDWEEIGADPSSSSELSWTIEKAANGWRGTVRVPLDMGRCLLVSRKGPTATAAQKKSVSAAASIVNNPAVAALIPPQAKFALNLVQSDKARNIAKKILKLF